MMSGGATIFAASLLLSLSATLGTDHCIYCICTVTSMNCSGKGATDTLHVEHLNTLQSLDLSHNDLSSTDEIFNLRFPSLLFLDISYTNLTYLPNIVAPSLNTIILTGNVFRIVTESSFRGVSSVRVIRGLEVQSISENAFAFFNPIDDLSIIIHQSAIPEKLFVTMKIVNLTLNVINALTLPPGLFGFGTNSLTSLTIIGQNLLELHVDLFLNLPILKSLRIVAPEMHTLPNDLLHRETATFLPNNLEEISISGIKSLPRSIFHGQKSLRKLQLYGVEDFPSGIFESVTLRHLDLTGSGVYNVPREWFGTLSGLEILNLSRTSLDGLNEHTFAGLRSLKTLDISNNDLVDITGSIFQHFNYQLVTLSICENNISRLDDDVFENMLTLQNLNLGGNKLSEITPTLFSDLGQLRTLSLKNNKLKQLPKDVFLSQMYIEEIDLAGNPLQCDCDVFGMLLKRYQHLRIYGKCSSTKKGNIFIDIQDIACEELSKTTMSTTFEQQTTIGTTESPEPEPETTSNTSNESNTHLDPKGMNHTSTEVPSITKIPWNVKVGRSRTKSSNGGMSPVAIALVCVASIGTVAGILILLVYLRRKARRRKKYDVNGHSAERHEGSPDDDGKRHCHVNYEDIVMGLRD